MTKQERIKVLEDEIRYISDYISRNMEQNYWAEVHRLFWIHHIEAKQFELMALTHPFE